jgi:uncharacterized membrane protein YgcG
VAVVAGAAFLMPLDCCRCCQCCCAAAVAQAAVLEAAKVIVESCRNLLQYFEDLAISNGLPINNSSSNASSSSSSSSGGNNGGSSSGESLSARFKAVLVQHVQDEGVIEWLVPPMLQGSNVDLDGWV